MWAFLACCLILWTTMGAAFIAFPKAWLHLALQLPHNTASDYFFRYYSSFAEWLLYVFMLVPLCFRKWRATVAFAIAEAGSAMIVQGIKHIVNAPRPMTWFTEQFGTTDMLQLVDGVKMHAWHSFPSGHTATFFAFFAVAAVLLNEVFLNNGTKEVRRRSAALQVVVALACFILALTGGYSRIYLSQHFPIDVFVGSVIGTTAAVLTLLFFPYRERPI